MKLVFLGEDSWRQTGAAGEQTCTVGLQTMTSAGSTPFQNPGSPSRFKMSAATARGPLGASFFSRASAESRLLCIRVATTLWQQQWQQPTVTNRQQTNILLVQQTAVGSILAPPYHISTPPASMQNDRLSTQTLNPLNLLTLQRNAIQSWNVMPYGHRDEPISRPLYNLS